ncbi:MAG TPA: GNAT family N-acetyltransferase [Streptosporangiaceae bacterium]
MKVTILSAAAELEPLDWDGRLVGAGDFYLSLSWLKVLEGVSSVRPFYLIAHDGHGRLQAGLTAYLMGTDAPAWDFYRLDRVLRRLAALPDRDEHGIVGVRGREPVTVMPHLLLGGRHTAHSRLLLAADLTEAEQRAARAALLQAAESLGREVGARSLAFMFVDEQDPLRGDLTEHGYLPFRHAQAAVMDIGFGTFDGYLSRLSAHRRKRVKRERRSFAEAGVVFKHRPLGEVIEEITPLGMALESRYGAEGDTVAAFQRSLRIVSDILGERAMALTAEQGGKIRGYVVTMRWNDVLILRSAGFDYDFKGKLPLYYGLIFYHVVEYALATGVRQVSYSIEAAAAKKSRGCRLIDEYGMARGLDDEAAGALRQVLVSGQPVTGS